MRVNVKASLIVTVVLPGLAGAVHPVQAQGLGEVARQEEERRKDIKAPAKVYTNKDLSAAPPGREGTVSSAPPAAAATDAAKAADDQGKGKEKEKDKPATPKDQAYWAGKKELREARKRPSWPTRCSASMRSPPISPPVQIRCSAPASNATG